MDMYDFGEEYKAGTSIVYAGKEQREEIRKKRKMNTKIRMGQGREAANSSVICIKEKGLR